LDTPLKTTKQTSEFAVEPPIISCHQKIHDSAIRQEVKADNVLRLSRSYPSILPEHGTTVSNTQTTLNNIEILSYQI
jgi:hypothetical protein